MRNEPTVGAGAVTSSDRDIGHYLRGTRLVGQLSADLAHCEDVDGTVGMVDFVQDAGVLNA